MNRALVVQHILAAAVCIPVVGFVMWARRDPIELLELNLTQKVRPGQMLTERAAIVRTRGDCRSTISAEIVDAQKIVHRVEVAPAPAPITTGEIDVNRNYSIPFSAAWGPARLIVQRTYYCWPFYEWWPIVNPRREMWFEIVPS